jgi:hypothetical protein
MSPVVPKLPLSLYIYSVDFKTHKKKKKKNPFVFNTINIWYEVQKLLGEMDSLSCFCPIGGNHSFTPGRADPVSNYGPARV